MKRRRRIAVALQGGGSHGAFTWGVLEALFADPRIEIAGFSGTSAGGMNAAAAVQGLIEDGPRGAIAALERFWRAIHRVSQEYAPLLADPLGKLTGDPNLRTSPGMLMAAMAKAFWGELSPYVANPANINPLAGVIESFFDFEAIAACTRWKLFLAATHVETGKIRIFHNAEIGARALLATACVPTLFQAVEVDGAHYWDGGYVANPAIFPLINECDAKDIVVVQLTKSRTARPPVQAAAIRERFGEITLNACLVREIRAIHLITRLIDEGKIRDPSMRRVNLHIIKDEAAFAGLDAGSTLNTDWDFLNGLRAAGRRAGARWLDERAATLGRDRPFDPEILDGYV